MYIYIYTISTCTFVAFMVCPCVCDCVHVRVCVQGARFFLLFVLSRDNRVFLCMRVCVRVCVRLHVRVRVCCVCTCVRVSVCCVCMCGRVWVQGATSTGASVQLFGETISLSSCRCSGRHFCGLVCFFFFSLSSSSKRCACVCAALCSSLVRGLDGALNVSGTQCVIELQPSW